MYNTMTACSGSAETTFYEDEARGSATESASERQTFSSTGIYTCLNKATNGSETRRGRSIMAAEGCAEPGARSINATAY